MTPSRDIVVIAASAGGLQPLRTLLHGLPADLPAALFVVLHVPATGGRALPGILGRSGLLPAGAAVDGEPIRRGRIYLAPPDQHLMVVGDSVRLSRGPRQNGVRPAADPLFRSAALYAGPRVTGVVLSGTLDDAALGSATVERLGGRVVVQDPEDADYHSMPRNAIAATAQPIVVPTADLARQVARLAKQEGDMVTGGAQEPDSEPDAELVAEIGGLLDGSLETDTRSRSYSGLTCPECSGPLYVANGERTETFDCLVGHRWSPQSLIEEQGAAVERALWLAIRSLEERGRLTSRLAEKARKRGHVLSADQFDSAAEEAKQSAATLRKAVNGMTTEVIAEPG
jgi:two-component system chemotaxis response regulator CheB